MTIQYCSDLHLEFAKNKKFISRYPLVPIGDILILGGDIVPFVLMEEQSDFFNFVSDNFEQTFWIPGNHEYYNSDINFIKNPINETIRSNVFLVNNQVVNIKNTDLIFATFWSDIAPQNYIDVQLRLSDFAAIRNGDKRFTPQHYNQLHQQDIKFIKDQIEKSTAPKKMVITHHAPTFLNYPPKYKNDILNCAFATEYFNFIESSAIDYWQYGHHHINTPAFKIGNTTLITNQLGYIKYKENKGFKKDAIIEI